MSGNGLLKVCVDISYQVKAIEVAEICFEEAAIADTCMAHSVLRALTSQHSILACG